MDSFNPFENINFDIIYNYVDRNDFIKYFRMIVTVCGYILLRSLYTTYAGKKHVERQLEQDKKDKEEEEEKKIKEEEEKEQKLQDEAQTFGWGKKTKASTKSRQAALELEMDELRIRHQNAYDAAEDHDIDDLLED